MQQASIDQVAEHAGFTKGAFYANFESKEELFLAMLDNRFAKHLEEIDRVLASDAEPEDQARAGAASFVDLISSDPEWERLFFEFSAYASRNENVPPPSWWPAAASYRSGWPSATAGGLRSSAWSPRSRWRRSRG